MHVLELPKQGHTKNLGEDMIAHKAYMAYRHTNLRYTIQKKTDTYNKSRLVRFSDSAGNSPVRFKPFNSLQIYTVKLALKKHRKLWQTLNVQVTAN